MYCDIAGQESLRVLLGVVPHALVGEVILLACVLNGDGQVDVAAPLLINQRLHQEPGAGGGAHGQLDHLGGVDLGDGDIILPHDLCPDDGRRTGQRRWRPEGVARVSKAEKSTEVVPHLQERNGGNQCNAESKSEKDKMG